MTRRVRNRFAAAQVEKWKAEIAKYHRQQRQQRGRRRDASSRIGPGMIRRQPPGTT